MSVRNSIRFISLSYVAICLTVREYYLPIVGVNLLVFVSFLLFNLILLDALFRKRIMRVPVGVILYSSYWICLLYLTLAAFIVSGSHNIFKYLLYVVPIIYIALRYSKDEIFINAIKKLTTFAILLNVILILLSFIEMSSGVKIYSSIRLLLAHFTIDPSQFIVKPSFRSQGVYYNSSSLASLGLFSIALNLIYRKNNSILMLLASGFLVIMSGSRIPLACLALFFVIYRGVSPKKLLVIFSILILVVYSVDLEVLMSMFTRIIRIFEFGMENDYSLSYRMDILWPNALEQTKSFSFGTLINPIEIVGVIDSGYLASYIQGRWVLVFSLVISIITLVSISGLNFLRKKDLFIFVVPLYIALGMTISNPVSDPLIMLASYLYIVMLCNNKRITVN
ncbi:hypothetical protein ACPV5O_16785 [Vibrio maritimus]|uniref:hypothetical protein n=1 Tax=Vibrio maritimus TaxID=990268 RepID=UPI0040690DB4